jgi:tetratricopeptide (TPR) repeat protein
MAESGQAHWRLGTLLETLHRDADALHEREEALVLAPVAGERRVLAVVARAYVTAGGLAKAEGAARARVADDLNDADAHDELGQIYRQEGREADALAELTVASLLDSSRDTTLSALAQIHLGAGRFDQAVEAARRALAKNPQNRDARVALELAEAKRLR